MRAEPTWPDEKRISPVGLRVRLEGDHRGREDPSEEETALEVAEQVASSKVASARGTFLFPRFSAISWPKSGGLAQGRDRGDH